MKPALEQFFQQLDASQASAAGTVPSKADSHRLADALLQFLFPILNDDARPARVQYTTLRHDLIKLLYPLIQDKSGTSASIADVFFEQLPGIYETLQEDAQAILRFDPAATCLEEVIATYPGFHAIAVYRIANLLHRRVPEVIGRHVRDVLGDWHRGVDAIALLYATVGAPVLARAWGTGPPPRSSSRAASSLSPTVPMFGCVNTAVGTDRAVNGFASARPRSCYAPRGDELRSPREPPGRWRRASPALRPRSASWASRSSRSARG